MAIDLSVEIKTNRGVIALRNPLLNGASELAIDENTIKRCIDNGAGGVVTKSVGNATSPELVKTTSRPWAFPLDRFGPEYRGAWVLQGMYFQSENTPEKVAEKRIPKWKKMCKEAGIPLIVSVADSEFDKWAYTGKLVEDAGADAIEICTSCPVAKQTHEQGTEESKYSEGEFQDFDLAKKVIKSVMDATTIPVGAKFSLFHNPVDVMTRAWGDAGLCFITGHDTLPSAGIFIDVEAEEVYGTPGQTLLIAGPTMLALSMSRLAQVLKASEKNIPVIGVGGIYKASDVIQYLLLGCTAVEVCSGAYFKGHKIFKELLEGLEDWMKRHGYTRIDQFRGKLFEDASCVKGDWEEKYGYKLEPSERGMLLPDQNPSPILPKVDMKKCTLCDLCDDICVYGGIWVDHEKKTVEFNHDVCIGCGMCIGVCPENPGALWLEDKRTNEVVWDGVGMVKSFKKGGFILD